MIIKKTNIAKERNNTLKRAPRAATNSRRKAEKARKTK